MRYFLEISYDGTQYHGWQVQNNALTVQEVLDNCLKTLLGITPPSLGCGRTDSGVHATSFYVQFDTDEEIDNPKKLLYQLNVMLPNDIACKNLFVVSETANARFDATYRKYEYHVHLSKNPFLDKQSVHIRQSLDVELMNEGAKLLLDYTDFASFCKAGSDNFTTNCDVTTAYWEWRDSNRLVFTIQADRFLRNMVRAIVGTLFMLGKHQITLEEFKVIVDSKNRSNAGSSVKACGLYLVEVGYKDLV